MTVFYNGKSGYNGIIEIIFSSVENSISKRINGPLLFQQTSIKYPARYKNHLFW